MFHIFINNIWNQPCLSVLVSFIHWIYQNTFSTVSPWIYYIAAMFSPVDFNCFFFSCIRQTIFLLSVHSNDILNWIQDIVRMQMYTTYIWDNIFLSKKYHTGLYGTREIVYKILIKKIENLKFLLLSAINEVF